MKIGEFWKLQSIDENAETQKKGAAKANSDFAALLQGELSDTEKSGSATQVSDLSATASLSAVSGAKCDSNVSGMIQDVDGMISMLQSLEELLKNQDNPKQVDQLIKKMTTAADKLQTRMEDVSGNEGLKDLANEVNVAALMESVKWRRGDYL